MLGIGTVNQRGGGGVNRSLIFANACISVVLSSCVRDDGAIDAVDFRSGSSSSGTTDGPLDGETEGETEGGPGSELFHHPWMDAVPLADGTVPFADVLDDADGRRFTVEVGFAVDANGNSIPSNAIVPIEVGHLTLLERTQLEAEAAAQDIEFGVTAATTTAYSTLDELFADMLGKAERTDLLDVVIKIEATEVEPLFVSLQKDMARQIVYDRATYNARRAALVSARQVAIDAAQDALELAIVANGGTVTHRYTNLYALQATVPASGLHVLKTSALVRRIGLSAAIGPVATATGLEVVKGSQIAPAIAGGYDGNNGVATDITFAVLEVDAYKDEHPGFKDGVAATTRIAARRHCTAVTCSAVANFGAPATNHATGVAGLIFGDLRDGQDPLVVTSNDRVQRSGYSGEANGELYHLDPNGNALLSAYDDLIFLPTEIVNASIANSKLANPPDDPNCLGRSVLNQTANDLYESGMTLVQAGGNDGHTSATACMVGSPGAAIGAFTVGAHGDLGLTSEASVRTAAISSFSPRGGTASQGGNRTIIDITAFGARSLMFDKTGGYTFTDHGTSFAAPIVTAAAINFFDFFHQANPGSVFLEDPGARHVNLLLLGDRTQEVAGKMTVRYSNLFGAGRLKMRFKTNANMDAPADWKTSSACIGHGEVLPIKINSGATLNAAIDDLKIAVFWYDRRHEKGTAIDNIDLRLRTMAGTSLLSSLSTTDNKERIFYSAAGNKALKFEIIGTNVTADDEGCGTNKMLVYYAYFYEDNARDDADGPTASVVDPE
jgi:hypothetical protein